MDGKKFKVSLSVLGALSVLLVAFFSTRSDSPGRKEHAKQEGDVVHTSETLQDSQPSGGGSVAQSQAEPIVRPTPVIGRELPDFVSIEELFRQLNDSVADLDSISEARALVAEWLASAYRNGEVSVDDLAEQLADTGVSVMARIIYAEAMLSLFSDEIREIDNTPIAETLVEIDAPVLSSRIIDVLAYSAQPELMSFVAAKAKEYPENIRLSALKAAKAFPNATESLPLVESLLQDENYYRVRIASIEATAELAPQRSFELLKQVVDRERELLKVPPREGQSRSINFELVQMATVRSLAGDRAEVAIQYLVDVSIDHQLHSNVRKTAIQSLAGVFAAEDALVSLIEDPDEGIRMHALRSLSSIEQVSNFNVLLEHAISSSSDTYVIEQLKKLRRF